MSDYIDNNGLFDSDGIESDKESCIVVGKYKICTLNKLFYIFIENGEYNECGEGGGFKIEDFEKVVKQFYDENF